MKKFMLSMMIMTMSLIGTISANAATKVNKHINRNKAVCAVKHCKCKHDVKHRTCRDAWKPGHNAKHHKGNKAWKPGPRKGDFKKGVCDKCGHSKHHAQNLKHKNKKHDGKKCKACTMRHKKNHK